MRVPSGDQAVGLGLSGTVLVMVCCARPVAVRVDLRSSTVGVAAERDLAVHGLGTRACAAGTRPAAERVSRDDPVRHA